MNKLILTAFLCILGYAGLAQDSTRQEINWMAAFPKDSVIRVEYQTVKVDTSGIEYVYRHPEAVFDFKADSCALDVAHYDFLIRRLRHVLFEEPDPAGGD